MLQATILIVEDLISGEIHIS